eukprot:TRINITY_DN9704_c1_g1_i1.p1 TRINITY_DN9704_c1_g1~~TRINITY_DN9704_c1_g1_i1.p1  ORF type:complete len:299 (+),score=51.65 TRINITY_DN9704_c1_g1_i1:70-966(+)
MTSNHLVHPMRKANEKRNSAQFKKKPNSLQTTGVRSSKATQKDLLLQDVTGPPIPVCLHEIIQALGRVISRGKPILWEEMIFGDPHFSVFLKGVIDDVPNGLHELAPWQLCQLLYFWLEQLPQPLIHDESAFVSYWSSARETKRADMEGFPFIDKCLGNLINRLPPVSYATLRAVLQILHLICELGDSNTLSRASTIFAPVIFRSNMTCNGFAPSLLSWMVQRYNFLFERTEVHTRPTIPWNYKIGNQQQQPPPPPPPPPQPPPPPPILRPTPLLPPTSLSIPTIICITIPLPILIPN